MKQLSWELVRGRRLVVPDHVVHRALAEETVLLNIKTSTYHAIDEIGARFFETMLASPSLAVASEALAAEYEQPLERIVTDLVAFCRDLHERELIELRPS